jgi:DNA-binding beta-propeller fold protein YncE
MRSAILYAGIIPFVAALAIAAATPQSQPAVRDIAIFESGQVRPLAHTPNGDYLFATNTPDNRLEVFRIRPNGLEHQISIPVGLEPVAVAARSNTEIWVVNHLSDSVSVVAFEPADSSARIVRTLYVGDEPRDIVFAGPGRRRAFITTAHRGQNTGRDPQLTTPGRGRADVWVFDAANLGADPGVPMTVITLFADTPRALAATPDGSKVYAAAFHSGNQTTIVSELAIPPGQELPPLTDFAGVPQPRVGLIADWNGSHWVDELGRIWDSKINFFLPDRDVFAIDAMAPVPAPVAGPSGVFAGVGTILYNMVVNPVSGRVYVSNTNALNTDRFEGPGIAQGRTVRGHHNENRITILDGARPAAPSQQAHRLLDLLRGDSERRECAEPGAADGNGCEQRRRDAVRGSDGLWQGGRLRHTRVRRRYISARPGGPDTGERRRSDGTAAQRAAASSLRAHAIRQRDLRRQHAVAGGDSTPRHAESRAGEYYGRPTVSVRRVGHLQPR